MSCHQTNLTIPRLLMHFWVGPRKPPLHWMETWKGHHRHWEYRLWDDQAVFSRRWQNQLLIDHYRKLGDWPGVADVARYEILYELGGFLAPADSECLRPIDALFTDPNYDSYAVYENEKVRPGLVSPLYACEPGSCFASALIEGLSKIVQPGTPWMTTGNLFMQKMIANKLYKKLKIWPSHYFNPIHYTNVMYDGPDRPYAVQQWGSTISYDRPISMSTEFRIRAAFADSGNTYEIHRPVLCEAVLRIPDGPILELGVNEGSTLPLHEVALATGRAVVTLENDRGRFERFAHLHADNHVVVHDGSWTELDNPILRALPYAIAVVDHVPVERRVVDVEWLAQRAKIVVVHNISDEDYSNQISRFFKYRATYKRHVPWTSIMSNSVDVSEWAFNIECGMTLKFIGDLSRQDAKLIEKYARGANSVLEFGVGGSTQIIAQSISEKARFLSLDTDPAWIQTTEQNLERLGVRSRCTMLRYEHWVPTPSDQFDLVFNDGAPETRLEFALRCFSHLRIGGHLLFHDTRGLHHVKNITQVIEAFYESIARVTLNEPVDGVASNITVIEKKVKEPYVNWNEVEGRPPWAFGHGTVPEEFWERPKITE